MTKVFPTAIEARAGARNNVRIYEEIRHLEAAVLAAIDAGDLSVSVTDSYMTSLDTGVEYCAVWLNELEDRSKAEQMVIVDRHFTNMGYEISRKLIADTSFSETVTANMTAEGTDPVDPDPGTVEIQTITVPVAPVRAVYSLTVGGTNLTSQLQPKNASVDDIVIAFQQNEEYLAAPFTIAGSDTDIVLTWKEASEVVHEATMRYSYDTSTFAWEILW